MICIAFPGGLSLRLAFGSFFSFFYPHASSPFIFPLINQCDRCLVPFAWGLMVGRRGFTRGSPVLGFQLIECGVRMVGSELNRTWRKRGGKKRRKSGASSPFSIFSPVFFPRQFFDRALLSERLEQANQGWLCQNWKPLDKPGTHLH